MSEGVVEALLTADLERCSKCRSASCRFPRTCSIMPKAGEALRQDVAIPGVVGEVHRLLGILFHKGHALQTASCNGHLRQMTETVPFLARIADARANLAHQLKIRNRRIVLSQQPRRAHAPHRLGAVARLESRLIRPLTSRACV